MFAGLRLRIPLIIRGNNSENRKKKDGIWKIRPSSFGYECFIKKKNGR